MDYQASSSYANNQDIQDPLSGFRGRFYFPKVNGQEAIYLCGNSLGLQPKTARDIINADLSNWKNLAVNGHFNGDDPWINYHKKFRRPLSEIVGCQENEVVVMNNLTVNLHLGLVSFYRPDSNRYKIICESHAFPSDQYAMESQVRWHGFDPQEAIIEVQPKAGEDLIASEDIVEAIHKNTDQLALVLFGGLQYYTGQFFDLEKIADTARQSNIPIGLDLAHAVGNVPLKLHEWGVDFAVWCSYKYLNSGPGAVSGMFIHEKHHRNKSLNRLAGWWGHNEEKRFLMKKGFSPISTADGWQLGNGSILNMSAHYASLQIFAEAGMARLRQKSIRLTGFLEFLLQEFDFIKILTPSNPDERGCQLSLFFSENGKKIQDDLERNGVIADWREPNPPDGKTGVIRVAPTPLYNSFSDIFRFYEILKNSLKI